MARRNKVRVELEGQEDLRRAFAQLKFGALREAQAVIAESAEEIQWEARERVPVLSGETKKSITVVYRDGGRVARIGSGYYLARFHEQGTSKMDATPFMMPAYELVRPKYLSRIEAALNRAGRAAEQV